MKKIMFNEIWKRTELYGRVIEFSNLGNYRFVDGKRHKEKRLNAYGYYIIPIYQHNKLHNAKRFYSEESDYPIDFHKWKLIERR